MTLTNKSLPKPYEVRYAVFLIFSLFLQAADQLLKFMTDPK